MENCLKFCSIFKTFPGVKALEDISFCAKPGEVHALMGENGAGKSTLLKIMSGAYVPTSGHIELDGNPHVFHHTAHAIKAGISVIYQELHLVPEMTVAENMMLGKMIRKYGIVNKKEMNKIAAREMDVLGLTGEFEPTTKVKNLSLGQRQMVEIGKALLQNAKVIAFDEPTSSLSEKEVKKLFEVIDDLRKKGRIILYVSHRMEEIFKICNAVTVFRDGKHVATYDDIKQINQDTIIKAMVGRSIEDIYNYKPRQLGEVSFEVEKMMGKGLKKEAAFSVRKGEILGVFGLVGAGRTELMKLIYGAEPRVSGKIRIEGKDVVIKKPKQSIRNGLMFCPEDRKFEGIIPIRPVSENINLSVLRIFARIGLLNKKREKVNAIDFVNRLKIKTPNISQLIVNLSGGNQQKAIIARWLSGDVRVLLMDEPTRGIDVGAKSEIYSIIYELAARGAAVVIVSSDLPEVLGISDRVMIMREGQIVAFYDRDKADPFDIIANALPVEDEYFDNYEKK